MPAPPTSLHRLVAPLRFLSQRDFAALGQVRGLPELIAASLSEARASREAGPLLALLERARESAREDRLPALADALRALVPHVLGVGDGASVPPAPTPPADRPGQPDIPAEDPRPPPAPADDSVLRARGKPVRRPRSARLPLGDVPANEDSGVPSAVQVLSISPRSGPLAEPLRGTGLRVPPRLSATLEKKGLRTVGDVLFLLPRAYEDRRELKTILQLRPGERGVTLGTVRSAGDVVLRPGRRGFRVVLGDATGSLALVYFQAGPWMKGRFPVGKQLLVSGELRKSPTGREMVHPEVEPAPDAGALGVHFGRIVPIYPGFERHEQRQFRELAHRVSQAHAAALEDPLPAELRARAELLPLAEALQRLHAPPPGEDLKALDRHQSPAHRRLAFDELFFLHLGMALRRQGVKVEPGIAFAVDGKRLARARALLPFSLTRAQARVVAEIGRDMALPEPMNRLLQGDVGSGKTAVALVAAALAIQGGYQVAMMAPTELLAAQHHATFTRLLRPFEAEVALVTGAGSSGEKREARAHLASGRAAMAVGTQALIQDGARFRKLGLVLIDEQHRFGVLQRHALMHKGRRPDVLVMTATPIPRTLAMTLYGDLDVSVLDELPPGRTPVRTEVAYPSARGRVLAAVEAELQKGHQAYVLYPLVEASEKVDLADATRGAAELAAVFPGRVVRLLHGRMGAEEKDAVMEAFRKGEVEVLVCTTVVEVGVDVPNASVMVIESAERFGLSQLHQLRGRVGRGAAQSLCCLVASGARSAEAHARLAVMERSTDGFEIAEKDLELRGPGEFLGTRQSGLPELAVANLARDVALSAAAAEEARRIAASDPRLQRPEHGGFRRALEERWEGRLALGRVG